MVGEKRDVLLSVGGVWGIGRRPVWVCPSSFCALGERPDVVWHCIPVWLFTMGETEHLERRSSRALIFLVLRSRVAFMSKFSCLTSFKSLFSPVTTNFRLFDCSNLNWSKSTRTPALRSVQMKVSEQHSSVEWRLGAMAVMEAAGSENLRDPSAMAASPSTEMALSLSSVGMGVLVVMTATGAVAI